MTGKLDLVITDEVCCLAIVMTLKISLNLVVLVNDWRAYLAGSLEDQLLVYEKRLFGPSREVKLIFFIVKFNEVLEN